MSFGDKLLGIETIYKGIKMKSKLESKFAYFLDALNIKFEYEPQTFTLSNGITYIPDFYLPELKTWVEVKGDIQENNKEISRMFVRDNKTELLLISNEEARWFSTTDLMNSDNKECITEDKNILIGKCSHCGSYFFCCNEGNYNCRKCLVHEGDHDIKYSLQSNLYGRDNIDFYDVESIKRGLEKYGTRI